MKRYEWSSWTDAQTAQRRAGGRRRYNAMRQRQAEARRAAILKGLEDMGLEPRFLPRGLTAFFAKAFGVHRTTIWRDLQRILYPPRECNFWQGDKLLFTVSRACEGGPIVSVTDADGNEIRGAARREILRRLPRYIG